MNKFSESDKIHNSGKLSREARRFKRENFQKEDANLSFWGLGGRNQKLSKNSLNMIKFIVLGIWGLPISKKVFRNFGKSAGNLIYNY